MDCDLPCDIPDCDIPDCGGCGDGCDWGSGKKKAAQQEQIDPPPEQSMFRKLLHRLSLTTLPDHPRGWSAPRRFGEWAIGVYQRRISPRLPIRCRYTPSCSHYGLAAVREYGLVRGLRLALGRILRCNGQVRRGTRDPFPVREPGGFAGT